MRIQVDMITDIIAQFASGISAVELPAEVGNIVDVFITIIDYKMWDVRKILFSLPIG